MFGRNFQPFWPCPGNISQLVRVRLWLASRHLEFHVLASCKAPVHTAVVVEDEWLVRMELADALTDAGWRVIEAATGEAALELLTQGHRIELLVTDIRLPGPVSGWDVAEKYREARSDVAVIYCSGNPANKARQVKDSVFLPKPCRMDLLLHAAKPGSSGAPNGKH